MTEGKTWALPPQSLVTEQIPDTPVSLADVIDETSAPLVAPLGRATLARESASLAGPLALDLALLPHLAIAGTSGSGKSSLIRSILASLLTVNTPDQLKLVLVDLDDELADLEGVPHLYADPIDDVEAAVEALEALGREVENRRSLFRSCNVRNISQYDALGGKLLPRLLCVVDEFAGLMIGTGAPRRVERAVSKLGIHGRKYGVHLILATQIPHATVLTAAIKANMNGRIALTLPSGVFSRVALDEGGAEQLRNHGDALLRDGRNPGLTRFQAAFLSREGLARVTDHWRVQGTTRRTPLEAPAVVRSPQPVRPLPLASAGRSPALSAGRVGRPRGSWRITRRTRRRLLGAGLAFIVGSLALGSIEAGSGGNCPSGSTYTESVRMETCDAPNGNTVCVLGETGFSPVADKQFDQVVAKPPNGPAWCPGADLFQKP